jgi:predicted hotdog family 3-hydroxylacyl-ACP dehydratase
MPLDRTWIESRIPHRDKMCLLDSVDTWDAIRIVCRATSHRDADNPLRAHGRLGVSCGIEYAAQAMAVHGALAVDGDGRSPIGYLTSVRNVAFHANRLDDIAMDLEIEAICRSGNQHSILYDFCIRADQRELLSGRAAVLLSPARIVGPREKPNP